MLRRRAILGGSGAPYYPILSTYPAIHEEGTFQFFPVRVYTNSNVSTCIRSGDRVYENLGSNSSVEAFNVTIDNNSIVLFMRNGNISVAFDGFPVRIKRCEGTEADPGVTMFSVTKLSD